MTIQQNHAVTLTREQNGFRVDTQYQLANEGRVSVSIAMPVVNPTTWEAEAFACEQAAQGLLRFAQAYREQIAKHKGLISPCGRQ
jgi:hypothetical protein